MSARADILVIDDDPAVRDAVGDVLREHGHNVDRVDRGRVGLERIDRSRLVDLAIVDLKLPDISGLEVLRGIKARSPETEVILITGHASLDGALAAMDGEASSFLVKPVNTRQLLSTVERALARQTVLRAIRESEARYRMIVEGKGQLLTETERLRAIGSLAEGVTDYVRQVLQVILGKVQLVLPQLEGTPGHEQLGSIKSTVMEAASVLRRLQVFTEVRALGEAPPLDLNDVVHSALEAVRPTLASREAQAGHRVRVELELHELPPVAGEASMLIEAVAAVLANAVEAMPRGGTLTVGTWVADQHVHCAVADTGVGIAPAIRPRVLEPFFTTKAGEHKGLGLSVACGLLRCHGGELDLGPPQAEGAVVTLRLPEMPRFQT
jgi:two-component system, NtrC family, sensor histidine kinase HydH